MKGLNKMQDILVYSMGTKATRRKAAVHYAAHSLSCGNLKKAYA